jgi:hypothetical protein
LCAPLFAFAFVDSPFHLVSFSYLSFPPSQTSTMAKTNDLQKFMDTGMSLETFPQSAGQTSEGHCRLLFVPAPNSSRAQEERAARHQDLQHQPSTERTLQAQVPARRLSCRPSRYQEGWFTMVLLEETRLCHGSECIKQWGRVDGFTSHSNEPLLAVPPMPTRKPNLTMAATSMASGHTICMHQSTIPHAVLPPLSLLA